MAIEDADLDPARGSYAAVETQEEAGTLVASISGELDLSNTEQIRSAIERALTPHTQNLVFEVRELHFMDSSGIALLAALAQRVSYTELRYPSRSVTRLIELTALDQLLHVVR